MIIRTKNCSCLIAFKVFELNSVKIIYIQQTKQAWLLQCQTLTFYLSLVLKIFSEDFSRGFFPQDFILKIFPEESRRRFFLKIIPEYIPWRFFLKNILEDFSWRYFRKIFPEGFSSRCFLKIFPKDFSWRFFLKIFPLINLLVRLYLDYAKNQTPE